MESKKFRGRWTAENGIKAPGSRCESNYFSKYENKILILEEIKKHYPRGYFAVDYRPWN